MARKKKQQRPPSDMQHRYLTLLIRERTGPELHDELSSRNLDVSIGTFYSTLRRMEEEGWIKGKAIPGQDGRIRSYRITAPGHQALKASHVRLRGLSSFGEEGAYA